MICCEAGEIRVPLATTLFIAWEIEKMMHTAGFV